MKIFITKYPTGKYGFVGSDIPVNFLYEKIDGTQLANNEINELTGDPKNAMDRYGIKRKVFNTHSEAVSFADKNGVEVANKSITAPFLRSVYKELLRMVK